MENKCKNFDFINAYYRSKLKNAVKVTKKFDLEQFLKTEFMSLDNFEIGLYDLSLFIDNKHVDIVECSRCKRKYKISLNNTFCPKCGIIRFLFEKDDLASIVNNYPDENDTILALSLTSISDMIKSYSGYTYEDDGSYIALSLKTDEIPIIIKKNVYNLILANLIARLYLYNSELFCDTKQYVEKLTEKENK